MPNPNTPKAFGLRTVLAKTCSICGQLRQGHEYGRKRNGFMQGACNSCTAISSGRTSRRNQRETQKTATKSRDPWTLSEIEQLEVLVEEGLSSVQIARTMRRTNLSIEMARHRYLPPTCCKSRRTCGVTFPHEHNSEDWNKIIAI